MRSSALVLCSALFAVSCGDSTSSSSGGGGGSTSSTTGGGGTGGSTTSTTFTFPVVINEIHATGEDWVELVNTGATPVDLAGYGLADTDKAAGGPKVADAARFPDGTTVAAGDRVFVVLEQDPLAGVGPHDVCLSTGGPSSCFYATWGISAASGEMLYVLAPDDSIVGESEYPMNAAPAPNTWGRLPDGTGDFTVTAPTPGEANMAP